PMTGKPEINGTSVVDVTDPAHPKYLAHIASGRGGAQMVRVCSGDTLPHGVKGKWYLLRPYGNSAHEIYDETDPAKPGKLVTIVDRRKLLTEFKNPVNPTPAELLAPQVGYLHMSPDQGAHTTMPIFGVPVPGFQGHQQGRTRDLLLVTSEAARADNCGQNYPSSELLQHRAAPHLAWLVDITHEATPWPLSTFRVQETQGDYCGRGGR